MTQPPPPPPPPPPLPPQGYNPNYYTQPKDDIVSTLIPYKNSQALISYYLGVFSLIPCLGLFLGIAAVILGVRGLHYANRNPQAKGKAHAIVGIVCGSVFGLAYLIVGVFILIGMASRR